MANFWWVIPKSFSARQRAFFEEKASAVHDECPDCKDKSYEEFPCPVCETRLANIFTFTKCFTSRVPAKLGNIPESSTDLRSFTDKNVIFYGHPAGEVRTAQLFRRQLIPVIKAGYQLHNRAFFYGKLISILPEMREYNYSGEGYNDILVHPELIEAARKGGYTPRLYIASTTMMNKISTNAQQLLAALLDSISDNDGQVVINTDSFKKDFADDWGPSVTRMLEKLEITEYKGK